MEALIQQCFDKISNNKRSDCAEPLRDNCFECFSNMYYGDNKIDYLCENKRLIYIVRYLPVHSSEIYLALATLFHKFNTDLISKKQIVFASWGAGPGIDTYAFHTLLKDYSNKIKCNCIINYRLENCTEWTDLAETVMFSNSPKKLTRKYYRKIGNITNPMKIYPSFDIATLSYIVSELKEHEISELIKNIKNNKSKNSYIIINDRNQKEVIVKIHKIMSELTEKFLSDKYDEEHCGFTFPEEIKENCQPKIYRKSVYFIGKLI